MSSSKKRNQKSEDVKKKKLAMSARSISKSEEVLKDRFFFFVERSYGSAIVNQVKDAMGDFNGDDVKRYTVLKEVLTDNFLEFVKQTYSTKIFSEVEAGIKANKGGANSEFEILGQVLGNHQRDRFILNEPFNSKPKTMAFDVKAFRERRGR